MRSAICSLLALAALTSAAFAAPHSVPLVRDGRALATIVTAAEPTVAANFAALELQAHVRRITGATLPLTSDGVRVDGPRVLVGESRATRALGLRAAALGSQEYLVRFAPQTVVLLGRDATDRRLAEGFGRAPGKYGRAWQCDGRNSVLSLADARFSDEQGTLEAWVWLPAAQQAGKHGTILRMDGGGPWTYHIIQRDMDSSRLSYATYDGQSVRAVASPPLAEGWHHVVGTHSLASGKSELFVDGTSVGTAPYVRTTCRGVPLNVGGLPGETGVGNPFRGLIDEVRVTSDVRPPTGAAGPYTADSATTVLLHCDEERGEPTNAVGGGGLTAPLPGLYEDRGTLDATYEFLERYCNVRWYAPTDLGTVTPHQATLTVRGEGLRTRPAMVHRSITPTPLYLPGPPETAAARDVQLWKLRMRLGGQPFWVCHSFGSYFSTYLKDHPDWFAQRKDGQAPQQPCYTSPGFIAQVVADARACFDANGDVYPLVPMDNNAWCQCPRCQAELGDDDKDNQQFTCGKASNYIFGFVNKVAREVHKTHPGKWIGALAYWEYAYYPTKLRVEPNVIVQPCLHVRNWWAPGMEANDRRVLDEWRAKEPARPLYLWLYYNFPALNAQNADWNYFPGYFAHRVVQQMAWYHERGVRGLFMEHSSEFGGSYLMDQLEFYVTLKLACDPSLDGNKLIDEFFTRYYGAAARPMQALYEGLEQAYSSPASYPVEIRQSGAHQHQTKQLAWGSLGTPARLEQLGRLMAEAKAAARTDEEKQRVALFEQGQWQYVLEGRRKYEAR